MLSECNPVPVVEHSSLYPRIAGIEAHSSPNSQAWVQQLGPSAGSSTHLTVFITALAIPRPVWRPLAHRNQHPALPARLPLHHHGNHSLLTARHKTFFFPYTATFPEAWFQAWQIAVQLWELVLKCCKVLLWHTAIAFFFFFSCLRNRKWEEND